MRRYTTPTHIFTMPFETTEIEKARVIYAQGEKPVFVKELEECQCNGRTLSVTLTQEETALLDCKKGFVDIQAHILTTDGQSLVSEPVRVPVKKCFDTEVLS